MGCMTNPRSRPFKWRQPLGQLVGKWEADLLRNHSREWARYCSDAIVRFFRQYPRKSDPAQVKVTDVEDYKQWRLQTVRPHTLRSELTALNSFWRFLYFELGLDIPSPVILLKR